MNFFSCVIMLELSVAIVFVSNERLRFNRKAAEIRESQPAEPEPLSPDR